MVCRIEIFEMHFIIVKLLGVHVHRVDWNHSSFLLLAKQIRFKSFNTQKYTNWMQMNKEKNSVVLIHFYSTCFKL